MSKLFYHLKKSLEECIAYEQGKMQLKVTEYLVPLPPTPYKAKEIKKIRESKDYSQGYFAQVLNVSKKTVQAWEAGRRSPNQAALRLLEIVDKGIYPPEQACKKN